LKISKIAEEPEKAKMVVDAGPEPEPEKYYEGARTTDVQTV
jgi:hypothetical protein